MSNTTRVPGWVELQYRYDRSPTPKTYADIKIQDYCQAMGTMPTSEFDTANDMLDMCYHSFESLGLSRALRSFDILCIRQENTKPAAWVILDPDKDLHLLEASTLLPDQKRYFIDHSCPLGMWMLPGPWSMFSMQKN